ncbi:hypothetical protein PFISCL1PPCAC_11298, partial [Pristionchus fissidentatus]
SRRLGTAPVIPDTSYTMDAVDGAAAGPKTVSLFGKVFPKDAFICRLFYFFYFASFGSLFPLLAVYFKQLGMTPAQAGLLLGIRPLMEFASHPFWGMFAARFKREKLLLLFSLASLIVFTLMIGFVQPQTPMCVVYMPEMNRTCKMALSPAGRVVHGGVLGLVKNSAGLGRNRRQASPQLIDTIIDMSMLEDNFVAGMAPQYITNETVCNYEFHREGILVSPPHSSRVYREPAVQQAFMLLLLLICLGEWFSSPAVPLADSATLYACRDNPKDYKMIRIFGSIGWSIAMFLMGIGLDYSDTFRNHPCPAANTTEKNYTLCFVMCSFFAFVSMLLATQMKFGEDSTIPTEVGGLIMDTRTDEVAPAVAEKARARQLQSDASAENSWLTAAKALRNIHIVVYLVWVMTIGLGAGLIFAFLYWHLQDLGGSPALFGIMTVLNHGSEMFMNMHVFKLINKYGHVKIMIMCLLANVVRFLLIATLDNPWMVLPLQIMQGMTLATTWAAATTYITLIAPENIRSSAQGILNFVFNGVGRGLGTIAGGFIINIVGTRAVFVFYALICGAVAGGGFAINKFFRYEGIKYSQNNMFDDNDDAMDMMNAPQGLPIRREGGKLTEAFSAQTTAVNSNYGTIDPAQDAYQDAYDQYVTTGR